MLNSKKPERINGPYRGRLAPTPSGFLHAGHAATFGVAARRCAEAGGTLILRDEDLDRARCKPEYAAAMLEDLRWLGFRWEEGPDVGGPFGPYRQSGRTASYRDVLCDLVARGVVYPSPHSRKEVAAAKPRDAPNGEPIFPETLRQTAAQIPLEDADFEVNWRFRVPDGQRVTFDDTVAGPQVFTASVDFGDFVVWRKDGFPSYELAVVADDHAMDISEVVRGQDLLVSTARQILIYDALAWKQPTFVHCPLIVDLGGKRLAKSFDSLAIQTLRERGYPPKGILEDPQQTALAALKSQP